MGVAKTRPAGQSPIRWLLTMLKELGKRVKSGKSPKSKTSQWKQAGGVVKGMVKLYMAWVYHNLGSDLTHILAYGAFLSLIFGVALLILPRKAK